MGASENGAWDVGNEVGCALGTKIKPNNDVADGGVKVAQLRVQVNIRHYYNLMA